MTGRSTRVTAVGSIKPTPLSDVDVPARGAQALEFEHLEPA